MRNVLVKWTVQPTKLPTAHLAHHFRVGFGVSEKDVPLTAAECLFENQEPGDYAMHVTLCDVNGVELSIPITGRFTVPDDAEAPIPLTIVAIIQ